MSLLAVGAAWLAYVGPGRWFALGGSALGALGGAVLGLRRRWNQTEVALFLDARLGEAELVTSALGCREDSGERAATLRTRAEQSLSGFSKARLRLPAWSRWHALSVPALAAAVWLSLLPARVAVAANTPGSKLLKRGDVPGLERIEALSGAPSLSAEDGERLKRLAEEARRLRADWRADSASAKRRRASRRYAMPSAKSESASRTAPNGPVSKLRSRRSKRIRAARRWRKP
ncbi:MAG: hypothetical protein QM756_00950 [Polyangiaceae bacterium]